MKRSEEIKTCKIFYTNIVFEYNFVSYILRSDSSNGTLKSSCLDESMKIKEDSPSNTYIYHSSPDSTVRETGDETIDVKKTAVNKQKKRPAPAPPKSSHMEITNIEEIKSRSESNNKCF